MPGYLSLVLHAHLPFIRHPEYEDFLEEDWYFEAMCETYLPLLDIYERLSAENTDFRLTMSLTPPLCNMMSDDLLRQRFRQQRGIFLASPMTSSNASASPSKSCSKLRPTMRRQS